MAKSDLRVVEHYNRGTTFLAQARYTEAEAEYRKGLELDLECFYSAVIHYDLGRLYRMQDQPADAESEFERGLAAVATLRADQTLKEQVTFRLQYALATVLLEKLTQQTKWYGREKEDLAKAADSLTSALSLCLKYPAIAARADVENKLEVVRKMREQGWSVLDVEGQIVKFVAGETD